MKSALRRFKFLGLLVLAFLIFVPTLVFGIDDTSTGYRINAVTTFKIVYPAGYSGGLFYISNISRKDYFIPTKTTGEFDSFKNNLPTGVSIDGGPCDLSPAGVYVGAGYVSLSECASYPACPLYITGGAIETSLGGSCGLLKKWRHMRCGALGQANNICQGEPCITAIVRQSDWGQVRFCTGTYDYPLKKCMYTGSTLRTVDAGGWAGFINRVRISQLTIPMTVGDSSWGTCSTSAPCGDTICSTAYGENCGSCPADCGVCPCGNYICDPGETCSNCPGDCGSCPCSDYTYESACTSANCYWHSYGYVCDNYPCEYYGSDSSSCYNAGCYWDSYNYRCVSASCSSYYDQYSCQSAGCTWDGYSCY